MFQPRSSEFDPRVAVIVDHLRAIQQELGEMGRSSGRRASANAVAAGNQIAEALTPILNDMIGRFRRGGQRAADQAAKSGRFALQSGTQAGSDVLDRLSEETRHRPFLLLAVAVGVGILIGAAGRPRLG